MNWEKLRYHGGQQALWSCKKRHIGVYAGRGSGKTELAKRKLVLSLPIIKDWPNPRYFYGAPTFEQAKRIAWEDLKALIPKEWVRGEPNESELRIRTIFGSDLWVFGLDKPQRAEGVQWDGGVIDESCDIKPGTVARSLFPAMVHRDAWLWRIGVPKRHGIGALEFKKFCRDAMEGRIEDAMAFNWPSDGIVPNRMLKHFQRIMDAKDYNEQFGGQFETAGGGVFYAFDTDFNKRPCPYHSEIPLIIGSDFNVDPMCWVIGHNYGNRIEWIDEIFMRDTNTVKTLKVLYERYKSHRGGFQFFGDATGQSRKTSASQSDYHQIINHSGFKSLGRTLHYPRSNPNVDDRFSACNAMLCNAADERRMFVDPRCENLLDDLEIRSYVPGTRIVLDGGDVGHMTDAMGYSVYKLFPIQIELEWETGPVVITTGS